MAATEPTHESIFSSTGAFVPLSDDFLTQQSDAFNELYQRVSDAYTASEKVDREAEAKTRQLHAIVADLRDCEARASKHKVTAFQNWKNWKASQ
jgi:hypothetical protein